MPKRRKLLDLLADHEPRVRKALLEAIRTIRKDVDVSALTEAIAAGDLDRAADILEGGREYFAPLYRAFDEAYWAGGDRSMDDVQRQAKRQGARVTGRFDGRNPRAETWLSSASSTLVREITEGQRAAVREAVRAGMEAGQNPRTTALEIAGRINKVTGRREGGIVGLTGQQAGWVRTARAELLSGDPARMQNYLGRKLRDRRHDGTVRRAIRAGKPVSAADVRKMTNRYTDRILKHRADTIARTETLAALHESQDEALRQLVDSGKVSVDQIERLWDSTGHDGRTRESHLAMEGQTAGVNGTFETPGGYRLQYPGDTSLGAPGSETINCRCQVKIRIDFFKGLT